MGALPCVLSGAAREKNNAASNALTPSSSVSPRFFLGSGPRGGEAAQARGSPGALLPLLLRAQREQQPCQFWGPVPPQGAMTREETRDKGKMLVGRNPRGEKRAGRVRSCGAPCEAVTAPIERAFASGRGGAGVRGRPAPRWCAAATPFARLTRPHFAPHGPPQVGEDEPLSSVKRRVQQKLGVSDEEIAKWKWAAVQNQKVEYLTDDGEAVAGRVLRKGTNDSYGEGLASAAEKPLASAPAVVLALCCFSCVERVFWGALLSLPRLPMHRTGRRGVRADCASAAVSPLMFG